MDLDCQSQSHSFVLINRLINILPERSAVLRGRQNYDNRGCLHNEATLFFIH